MRVVGADAVHRQIEIDGLGGRREAGDPRRYGAGAILVVEDDPEVRELLELLLRNEGHRVAAAPDGIAALAVRHPRFGYRRVHEMLRRQGLHCARRTVQRIRRDQGLKH